MVDIIMQGYRRMNDASEFNLTLENLPDGDTPFGTMGRSGKMWSLH